MKTNYPNIPWLDASFYVNRSRFPPDELLQYAGQYIAWSWDGSRILDSDQDRGRLDERLRDTGVDLARVVHDYVDELEDNRSP